MNNRPSLTLVQYLTNCGDDLFMLCDGQAALIADQQMALNLVFVRFSETAKGVHLQIVR